MFSSQFQLHKTPRITAWLVALVCAWMGTGGVLNHTEAEANAQPPRSAASLHRLAAVPTDTCAACEWTQGMLGRTLSVCRIPSPQFYFYPRRHFAAPAALARTHRCRPSRAPPVSFSSE